MKVPFFNFVIFSSVFYIALLLILGIEQFHISSILGQIIAFIILKIFTADDLNLINKNAKSDVDANTKVNLLPVVIVIFNTILGIVNLLLLDSKLVFRPNGRIDEHSIFLYSGIIGIVLAQTVGWVFQSFVVKLFATFVGAEGKLTLFINATGYAYIGFLTLSCYTLLYNIFFISDHVSMQDFNETMSSSWVHVVPSKIAEIAVIGILAYQIFLFEKAKIWKCLIMAAVPSALLGLSYLSFKALSL